MRALCSAITSKDHIDKIILFLRNNQNFQKYNKFIYAFRLEQQPNQNQYGNQQPNQYGNQQPNQAGGNNPWQGVVQPQFLNSLGNQPQQNNNFGQQPPQQQQNTYGVQPNNQWGSPQNNAPNTNNANNNMYPTVPAYNGSGNPNTQQNTQGNSNQGQQMAFQLFGGMQGLMNQQQSNQNNPNKPY